MGMFDIPLNDHQVSAIYVLSSDPVLGYNYTLKKANQLIAAHAGGSGTTVTVADTNSGNSGVAWERAGSVEFIYPDGSPDKQVNCGVRMQGGVGRNASFPKHSFRLLFKRQYGDTKLRFPLFRDALNSYPRNVVDGTAEQWLKAHAIANAGVADQAGYDALSQYLDIPNLIDYMMLNFYGGNLDWDDHNWYSINPSVDGGVYKFVYWDAERTLENVNGDNSVIRSFTYNDKAPWPESSDTTPLDNKAALPTGDRT